MDPIRSYDDLAALPTGTRVEDAEGDGATKLANGRWETLWHSPDAHGAALSLPVRVLELGPSGDAPYFDLMRTFNFGDRVRVSSIAVGHFTLSKPGDEGVITRLSHDKVFVEITKGAHVKGLIPFQATEIEHMTEVVASIPSPRRRVHWSETQMLAPYQGQTLPHSEADSVPNGTMLERVLGGFRIVSLPQSHGVAA